ncbi:MAG TPA: hypothetical protein VFN96_07600 [Gemmatimonadales bacterium]|nr:hypothetical protein [Gemmatimonadales bacterium]
MRLLVRTMPLLWALAVVPVAGAQETAPLVLRIPAGARAAALGDAFAAGRGSEMVFYHPAQIGLTTGLSVSTGRFRSGGTFASLATSGTVGPVAIAAGVQWLDYGSDPGTFPTPPGDLTLPGETSQSLAATAAGAVRFKGLRWGVAVKYVEERLPGARPRGAAFDVGVAREVGRYPVALAVQNLGGHLEDEGTSAALPRRLVLGAATPRWPIHTWFDLAATAALAWEREDRLVPAGGIELTWVPLDGFAAALRVGARRVEGGPRTRRPVTAGAGFTFDRFSLDYAYEGYSGPGGAHRLGIRIQ